MPRNGMHAAWSITAAGLLIGTSAVAGLAMADDEVAEPTQGRCHSVAHIGDSTSVGMTDPAIIPDPQNQLPAKYKSVAGVDSTVVDATVGRAVIEPGEGTPGLDALRATVGQADCVVIALGTNDAVNIAGGSTITADSRIDQMMQIAAGKPVIWPTVQTTAAAAQTNQAAAPESMAAFNQALTAAAERYPNLAVLPWDLAASDDLFAADGIHYTADGTQRRIDTFAAALNAVSHEPADTTGQPTDGQQPVESTETPAAATDTAPAAPATVTETVTVTVTAPPPA